MVKKIKKVKKPNKKAKDSKKDIVRQTMKDISKGIEGIGVLDDEEQLFIMPTIFESFNRASLVGGLPGGCIIEVHGPNMGGKTALGLAFLVSAQKAGHITAICDAEGSFKDKEWPEALGVDLENTIYLSGKSKSKKKKSKKKKVTKEEFYKGKSFEELAESVNDTIINFLKKQQTIPELKDTMLVYLVDSITAMTPEQELIGELGKSNYGLHAALTSRWLKKLNALILGTNVSVVIINQERAKMNAGAYEASWQSACGEALKYYAHFRVRVLRSKTVKEKIDDVNVLIAREHRFIVEKNKVSAGDEIGYFYTSTGRSKELPLGWDLHRTVLAEAINVGVVEKDGKQRSCDYDDDTREEMLESKMLDKLRSDNKFYIWLQRRTNKEILHG